MRRRTLLALALCQCSWRHLGRPRRPACQVLYGIARGSGDQVFNRALGEPGRRGEQEAAGGNHSAHLRGPWRIPESALDALEIPVDSQLLVFSRDSLQGKLINEQNPRALYFSDRVALGWVRDGDFIEVAAHDESAGVVFYTLEQRSGPPNRPPQFMRAVRCLGCHSSGDTLGVPGLLMFSTTHLDQSQGPGRSTPHRSQRCSCADLEAGS